MERKNPALFAGSRGRAAAALALLFAAPAVLRPALPLIRGFSISCRARAMAWCDGLEVPRLLIAPAPSTSIKKINANAEGSILSLRHPQSDVSFLLPMLLPRDSGFGNLLIRPSIGKSTCYIFREGSLQELHWFKQSYGSWFLEDYVCEDGSLYITTPVDPIFVLLPIFEEARMKKERDQGMFRQLDEILYVDGYPGYQKLYSLAIDTMDVVCEVKEIGSSKYYRLDNWRVLVWMCCKVQNLKATLLKLDKNYAAQEEKETLKDAVSILGEYVKDEPWLTLLCRHLQLDIGENKETKKAETGQTFLENTPPSYTFQAKVESGKAIAGNKKPPKKLKTEVNSQNIKDMFRRSTRKGAS